MNRREMLKKCGTLSVAVSLSDPILDLTGCRRTTPVVTGGKTEVKPAKLRPLEPSVAVATEVDNFDAKTKSLLEVIRERGAHYFFERADPRTGLVCDRAPASGTGEIAGRYAAASIAATGFGLSALTIAARHQFLSPDACTERLLRTLKFLANEAPQEHGFFPHFLDVQSGQRQFKSEFSSIDTTLLLFGAFHARSLLNSAEADQLVKRLFERVDWRWMQNAPDSSQDKLAMLSMGWLPETGFLSARWTSFSECLLMYAVAIASETHGLPPAIWDRIERHVYDYGGIRFISSYGALFIHQYPHLWLDLRMMRARRGIPSHCVWDARWSTFAWDTPRTFSHRPFQMSHL
jgi:hypothetical protein